MAPPLEDPELEDKDKGTPPALDEDDIKLLKTYGVGPYAGNIKKLEEDIKDLTKKVNELRGIKESDTGLDQPSHWDLVSDKQAMQEEQPLQVARCTKIINPNTDDAKVRSLEISRPLSLPLFLSLVPSARLRVFSSERAGERSTNADD